MRRIVICSVIRRGISSLLGSGGVNASVVMRCVCVCVFVCCMYILDSGDCILDVLLLIFCSLLHILSSTQSKQGYDKHGSATNCDCCGRNVGPNKMCVWQGGEGGGEEEGGVVAGSGGGTEGQGEGGSV